MRRREFIELVSGASLGSALPMPSMPVVSHELSISGARFLLDGKPFHYTGVSFFNAIYNPSFGGDHQERVRWLRKFQRYGINVLRVWAQWDTKRGFVDSGPDHTLYFSDGRLRMAHVERLKHILADADREGMVVELTLFSRQSRPAGGRLTPEASGRALAALTRELIPYRNVTFQVWNEFSELVPEHVKTIKAADPKRLVTNSPGGAGVLKGSAEQPRLLDYLTPHTSRQGAGKPWVLAPAEIHYLLLRYKKPVVDDEPARTGTPKFGGPGEKTYPYDHIIHIWEVWKAGGYITYHHDMFQMGAGAASVPPSGVPDPEFSPYHHTVFEFIRLRNRYAPDLAKG